jgi:hypothetical protein
MCYCLKTMLAKYNEYWSLQKWYEFGNFALSEVDPQVDNSSNPTSNPASQDVSCSSKTNGEKKMRW